VLSAVILSPVRKIVPMISKRFEPGIVVKVDGGLGSQMWQYALGRAAGKLSGLPVYYDLSWFDGEPKDINKVFSRAYRLESVFPKVSLKRTDAWLINVYHRYFNVLPVTRMNYEDEVIASDQPRYLGGYYVNARYVDQQGDGLRDEFEFSVNMSAKNREVLSFIESERHSVALHIRRGDYVGSVHDVTTPRYFRESVKALSDMVSPDKAVFFVFSNGMDWSREVLEDIDEKFVFLENNDNDHGEADMYMMSMCSHFIISNSSFSWWPAWLSGRSPGKIVIMPDVWLSYERPEDKHSMKLKDWIALPVS
jgi:hypothetical protein